jgi:hypothetical protein
MSSPLVVGKAGVGSRPGRGANGGRCENHDKEYVP